MAEKKKTADRDLTLINILERMADQLQRQDTVLTEMIKQQGDSMREAAEAEFCRSAQQGEADAAHKRIQEALTQYRATMLSLVHEQDSINLRIIDMNKLADKTAYSLESFSQTLSELDNRVKKQEATVSEHFAHSIKQAEALPRELASMGRDFAKLHADTEKRLGQMREDTQRQSENMNRDFTRLHADTEKHLGLMHEETQRQLDKLKQETIRRLMVLDGMESALQTLLVRTEPPEKKPLLITRIAKKIGVFFRNKVPIAIKKIRVRRKDMR